MLIKIIFSLVLFLRGSVLVESKENVFTINGKKSINAIDSEFISFSVDLSSLLNNIKSSNSFVDALTPTFLRVLDVNGEFLFATNESLAKWKTLQEWLQKSRLVPIFSIANRVSDDKHWEPTELVPFLDVNEQLGHSCYWQLVYDCDYKSLNTYKEDLMKLKYIVDMYSPSKIVSSNLRSCKNADANVLPNIAKDLEGVVDAYIWDFLYTKRDFVPTQTPTWIAMPKTKRGGFQTALQWAKQIGEAARNSYNVMFWHNDFEDIFGDTPVFWTSFLFGTVIGQTVLDLKSFNKNVVDATAFCAKNHFKPGAVAISLVNNGQQEFVASIKLASNHPRYVDVQKYILTSEGGDFTYLNGDKLSSDSLVNKPLKPQLETMKVDNVLRLIVPAQSIGLFVLPDAKLSACGASSNFKSEEEESVEIESRFTLNKNVQNFDFDELKNTLNHLDNAQENDEIVGSKATANDFRHFLGNKVKTTKKNEKPTKLETIFNEKNKLALNHARHIDLQLTNEEIRKILLDRAKARVSESGLKTNNKLELQMLKAAKKMIKNDNADKQKYKRFATNPKRRLKNVRKRNKRDINIGALKRKVNAKNEKPRDLVADLAPRKNFDFSVEEDVLKSGERYVDERIQFLKEPSGVDSALEDDSGFGYFENIDVTNNGRLKRDTDGQGNSDGSGLSQDVLGNIRKWQNRFSAALPSLRRRYNSDMVSTKRNRKGDSKLLKEKLQNRLKMNDWIRDRKMKTSPKSKRSLTNEDEVYVPRESSVKSASQYVPRVTENRWKIDNLRLVETKPSYSVENLDENEFLQDLSHTGRQCRSTNGDVRIIDNVIEDESVNKIPKIKFYNDDTTTVTTVHVIPTTEKENTFNETGKNITVIQQVDADDKIFFNGIVDTVRDFIERVYDKISGYFMG